MDFLCEQEHVDAIIHNRHNSVEWLESPNRNPHVIRAAFTTAPVRTKTVWKYDDSSDTYTPREVAVEYMYTADEMQSEINNKLHRAETVDPYAHPDYKSTRFSTAELLEHVVPHLPKCQPAE